jgi:hypothetical protein
MRVLVLSLVAACAIDSTETTHTADDACGGVIVEEAIVASPHVPLSVPIEWPNNPPTSGPHWPIWAAWDRHYDQLERGYWLHDAEHGAIVLGYRDPELAAPLDAFVQAQPADPHCDAPVKQRAIVVADPELPTDHEVYAIAWGVYYAASCIDPVALAAFYEAHVGRGAENTCAEGANFGGVPLY